MFIALPGQTTIVEDDRNGWNTGDPARRPRTARGPVAAREWVVAHAAASRALLTQPPAVLLTQVGDPLLPLQIGIWNALLALLRPGAEPEALAQLHAQHGVLRGLCPEGCDAQ